MKNLVSEKLEFEFERLKKWANLQISQSTQLIGWECNYEEWEKIYDAVEAFVKTIPCESWTPKQIEELLYILARSNEDATFIRILLFCQSEAITFLADQAIQDGEADAKWQLAEVMGLKDDAHFESLLIDLANDENEYVRRRAIQSLAKIGSSQTESLAIREWDREEEAQQWARMNALGCLNRVGSPYLKEFLEKAAQDRRPHLTEYALKVRRGETEKETIRYN